MRRREFITLIGGTTLSYSIDAQAQKEPTRLAFLGSGAAESSTILLDALKDGLRENGLIEKRDYIIDVRWANGAYDRFPAFARELAQSNPRVILVTTIAAARAAQRLIPPIPVVMTGLINPVDAGLIKSGPARRQHDCCFDYDSGCYNQVVGISACHRSEGSGDRCAL
jgi:putative ABC transport system substrate-binding protein